MIENSGFKCPATLFYSAIFMSGSVLAPWASQQKPRDNAIILAKNMSCPIGDSMEMITCLKVSWVVYNTVKYLKLDSELFVSR